MPPVTLNDRPVLFAQKLLIDLAKAIGDQLGLFSVRVESVVIRRDVCIVFLFTRKGVRSGTDAIFSLKSLTLRQSSDTGDLADAHAPLADSKAFVRSVGAGRGLRPRD